MGRRTVLLIVALLVAALGTTLVWMYANRAEEAAQAGQSPVEVLVATTGIPAGTTGGSISELAYAELKTLPAASIPAEALSDLTPVRDLVAVGSIFEGQVLLRPMFDTSTLLATGLTLPEGTMAVSISLGDPQRVAGFVKPGSEVAIFVTAEGVGDEAELQTAVLLESVPVAAVGPTTVSQAATGSSEGTNPEAIPTAILTLALTQEQAQKVIQGQSVGSLYFGLLNQESEVSDKEPGTTNDDLLG